MDQFLSPDPAAYVVSGYHRIVLGVAYNGRHYHGWQQQVDQVTIQQLLEQALSHIADEPIKVVCAGRTDAGVHASGQVVHFDTSAKRPLKAWVHGSNINLPDDIAVQWAHPVDDSFHARFGAKARHYRYVIYNHPMRPALMDKEVCWNYRPLEVGLMQQASDLLVGRHDFSSFRAASCQSHSAVRTIYHLRVIQSGRYIVLDVRANAFLHHMIRNLAGLLMKIGAGQAVPEWAAQVLAAQDRRQSAATAPPYGLYFVAAEYDAQFNLPRYPLGPHFLMPWL